MTEVRGQCPSHTGDTEGSDSYFWNDDKQQGHCKSCDLATWVNKKTGSLMGKRNGKTFEITSGEEQPDLNDFSVTEEFTPKGVSTEKPTYQGWRGVSEATMELYGVTTTGNKIAFRYPSGGNKYRLKDAKEFYAQGLKSDELFGMNLFPAGCSKKVTITEGELDALSAYQMLKNGTWENPVVSLPSATPSGKLWEKCKGWLDSFEEIILSVDNDDPGRKLAEKVSLMFPGKVLIMDHGEHKDANDFLMAGDTKTYKNLWWKAKKFRPDGMLVSTDDYLKLFDESPDFEYFTTGVPELDEKILGINKGYFTVIQAPTGVGKTEVMRYLEYRCLKAGYKFGYLHLEESRLRSVLGLVSYELRDNLTLKKFIDEKGKEQEVRDAIENLTLDETMIKFPYSPEDGYESLLDTIKYLVAAFDIDYVFFEPIQDLVNGEDKESKLADLASRLGTMASDLGVGIVTIAHQNKDGDTMYASMIGKKAAFEIVLKRDQEAEDLTERNTTHIYVGRKNRVGLGNGPAGRLKFDHETYTLVPVMPPEEPKLKETRDDF